MVRVVVRVRAHIQSRVRNFQIYNAGMMTSLEPARTTGYSPDIGWRVVWQRLSLNYRYKDITMRLQIGVGTAHRIFKKFELTGDVTPLKRSARMDSQKLDEHHELYILGLVAENPGVTLREICSKIEEATNVSVSGPTVCRVLRRSNFTRKKIVQVAKQRSTDFRASFMAHALQFPRRFFVWVDETGSDGRDQIRKFGYALRGEPPVYHRFLVRGTRISAVTAMCTEGVVDYHLTTGTVNSHSFFDFVRGQLIPNMQPFPGDRSVLIIRDNCSVHHSEEVKDLVTDAGILLLYLPPYSPDYNPIEELFSYAKYYLKEHDEVAQALGDVTLILKSAFDNVTSNQCNGWITHSGYA